MQLQLGGCTEKEYCLFSFGPSAQAAGVSVVADSLQAAVACCSCGEWVKDVFWLKLLGTLLVLPADSVVCPLL